MAQLLLVSILAHNPPSGSDLSTNDVIDVYWNDVTEAIDVEKNSVSWGGSAGGQIGEIDVNYRVSGISSYDSQYAISVYSFCDTTTLNWFRMARIFPSYPFMERVETVDSPVCGTATCDIHFVGPLQVTNSTDLTSNNGQVIALAESSNGIVKYSLSDFVYATEGQTSGTFTGLSPGEYTIYAKDENDCTAQLIFTILFQPEYAEHHRFTWSPIAIDSVEPPRDCRLRIYEREYSGDVVLVGHADRTVFNINKPKQGELNDKFYPIHPTFATMFLMSTVDYQYLPLYTNDNKKFKVVYEVDEGSGFEVVWSGFILPSVYHEPFIAAPYPTEFQIADNVKTLEQEPFADDNGNLINGDLKLIKVIAHVMKKTGLALSIRSGINIFEANHNTAATDDPLDQTYVDVSCYRRDGEPFNCWEVIESILRPFGARIYQEDGVWCIEEIDKAVASYNYRTFDSDGDYVSNSSFNPIMDIKAKSLTDRVAFIGSSHDHEIIPAYGKVEIKTALNYIGSIVAGGFEKKDLLSPESEVTTFFPGIFSSEEGFRDWSLRLNGTTGAAFGRTVISDVNKLQFLHLIDANTAADGNTARSVGCFYFNAGSWTGNLRNAYIESAAKNYQYGPNDEIRIFFEHSVAGAGHDSYPFMILRFSLKVGSNYLQQDRTWDTDEAILRAYPKPSTSFQSFELFAPVPFTQTVVDSTIQIRIYYYAKDFYDYGSPTNSDDPDDGTDGYTTLDSFITDGFEQDYRFDLRAHLGIGKFRKFFELRESTQDEDLFGDIVRAGDYDGSTNPKTFFATNVINETNKTFFNESGHNPKDRLFFIDNVAVDSLPNGQAPPTEGSISLEISKYINETLEVPLYNFDLPDIRNGKNMYNNYFKLSDGTPTALWTRSGIDESLPLQSILLKVLGGNHSAPTFRLTGSFINEFSRVKISNYLRLTKAGSNLSLSNTEFASNLTGWSQTGSGTAFAWSADNSGSAEVTLTGAVSSQKIYQEVTHTGGYVVTTVNLKVVPAATNDREDVLWIVYYNGSSIVHMEKMKTFSAPTSESDYDFTYTHFVPGLVTRVGFFIANVAGTDECTYQVGEFSPVGTAQQEVYQIADYSFDDNNSSYTFELMQLSKSYISLQGTDQGGDNQSGGETGSSFSGDFNDDFGTDFDTILN